MKLTYLFALAPHSQLGTIVPAEVGRRGKFMVGGLFFTLPSITGKCIKESTDRGAIPPTPTPTQLDFAN